MYSPQPLQPTRYFQAPALDDFKLPALPKYRPMTPSTSTVAASSSPKSSPVRRAVREVYPARDRITVLGRHKHHPTSTIPPSISVLDSTRRVDSIDLPRTASHASRIHCAVECTEAGLRLVVVGQNGVRVRHDGIVQRMKKGDIREFEGDVEVDFFGCKVRLCAPLPPAPTPIVKPETTAPVDLPALIASTVVFSGSSKLSLPDLVKHMLESQPSLRDHGDDATWTEWCASELDGNPMFGKVQRHGKDSSGHPLLPHYFYVPDADPDSSRAKQLGGLVRPLRAAQRAGGKAIDWRPVGSGRRRY